MPFFCIKFAAAPPPGAFFERNLICIFIFSIFRLNTFTYNPMDSEEVVFELVKLFVEHGATLKLRPELAYSILKCAACKYSVRVLQYLLAQEGAEINPANRLSPLAAAFLELGDISEQCYRGAIEAQISRLKENIEYLLMRGADINHPIESGIPWWYILFSPDHIVGIKLAAELGTYLPFPSPPIPLKVLIVDFLQVWILIGYLRPINRLALSPSYGMSFENFSPSCRPAVISIL